MHSFFENELQTNSSVWLYFANMVELSFHQHNVINNLRKIDFKMNWFRIVEGENRHSHVIDFFPHHYWQKLQFYILPC